MDIEHYKHQQLLGWKHYFYLLIRLDLIVVKKDRMRIEKQIQECSENNIRIDKKIDSLRKQNKHEHITTSNANRYNRLQSFCAPVEFTSQSFISFSNQSRIHTIHNSL